MIEDKTSSAFRGLQGNVAAKAVTDNDFYGAGKKLMGFDKATVIKPRIIGQQGRRLLYQPVTFSGFLADIQQAATWQVYVLHQAHQGRRHVGELM